MSALKEGQCYGLSSGRLSRGDGGGASGGGGGVSVLHVKLTDSAAKAIGSFQQGKVRCSPKKRPKNTRRSALGHRGATLEAKWRNNEAREAGS